LPAGEEEQDSMRHDPSTGIREDADFLDWQGVDENRFFMSPEVAIAGGWALRIPTPRGFPQQVLTPLSPPRSAS
jgi:hypothetical protein